MRNRLIIWVLPALLMAYWGRAAAQEPSGLQMVDLPGGKLRMAATEVTNRQYEAFDPTHRRSFSTGDDDAVTMVSWDDARRFCLWLSQHTGRHFRLPSEEEWEWACRAGTATPYNTGLTYPYPKAQANNRIKDTVSLQVAMFPPNAWGLYDMHGNVEEWCIDPWDAAGTMRVTRGGSHNMELRYLRSDARAAALADDRSVLRGFRVVEEIVNSSLADKPFFAEPMPYIVPPADTQTPFFSHNHQPAVVAVGNDLLAIWFSTDAEAGREMVVLQSRWHDGVWQPAALFFKVPERNMTGSALMSLADGTLLHMGGVGDAGEWRDLALCVRRSVDGGRSWSPPVLAQPEHTVRHQVIAGPIATRSGRLLLCCDAGPGGDDGTALHASDDGGLSWRDLGGTIRGIHAGIVELADGSLMALGRGQSLEGHMPCSRSYDSGVTWHYSPSPFPPIGSGQRLVLRRLQEGPLMLCSFGQGGLYVALSYDEGTTWPVCRLLTDGHTRTLDGGAWTGTFTLDATHAEPAGYLACTQTPDGVIHLLSSRVHYRFNLKWIEQEL